MTVVSSFSAADMDPARLRSEGAKMLARYLAYAESGGANLGHAAKHKPALNPFERDVEAQLRKAGHPADRPVRLPPATGSTSPPSTPPGPARWSSPSNATAPPTTPRATARDRDRLRQEHLERLGWRFHRIWYQDWFFHREAEIARARAAYQAAVTAADQGESRPAISDVPQRQDAAPDPGPNLTIPARRVGPCPVPTRRGSISEYGLAELTAIIRWIESDTLLRTEDELLAEAVRVLGFGRRGSKITAAITAAIAQARRPTPTQQAPFSAPAGMTDRGSPPSRPQPRHRR